MTQFTPGNIVCSFSTEKGEEAIIRFPMWEDLDSMTSFINTISLEDIYTTFSGEKITKEGEMYYLSEMFKSMELQNCIYLGCFINGEMIGSATVVRDMQGRKRSYHVGIFGITIARGYRGEGIGEVLAKTILEEAKKYILGLQLFILNVYSPNEVAQNLYRKLGFKEYGRLPKGLIYKGNFVDAISMYKIS